MANLVFDFLHNYKTGERRASDPADAYQYDEGHVFEAVVPVAVTSCEIHYWARGFDEAEAYTPASITQNTDNSYTITGNIPNKFFETYGDLRVYIVVTDGDASITTYEGRIHICERSRPDDYVDDDPDNEATRVLVEARAAAETATAAAQTAQDVADSIPADYTQLSDDVSSLKDGLSDVEAQVTAALVTDTASGSIASFPDGADGVPVKSLTVDIEPVQSGSGDPSPTNVRPISGHTSAVVTRTGKNLVDISQFATQYPDYCSYSDGVLSVTAASVLYSTGISVFIPAGSTINWSITNGTSTNARVRFVFADGTVVSITGPIPFQTTKDVVGLRFDWSAVGTFTVNNFQAELGSTATAYESPNVASYTIDLDGTRYGGTLDVTTGVLTVETEIKTLNGSEGFWSGTAVASGTRRFYTDTSYVNKTVVACDSAKISTDTTALNIICVSENRLIMTPSWAQSAATIADFKTLLASNNVTIIQTLATPFTVQLTANEISTVLGQNNVWNDCGDTTVEYRADTKLYINKVLNA